METAGGHGSSREERLGKRYTASLSLFFLSFFRGRSCPRISEKRMS
jgi:hypothetical protein